MKYSEDPRSEHGPRWRAIGGYSGWTHELSGLGSTWKIAVRGLAPAVLLALGLLGCGEDVADTGHPFAPDDSGEAGQTRLGVDFCRGVDCDQLINVQLAERYHEARVGFVRESDVRLCRRMSLDLTDHIPTWDEVEAHCLGRSAEEMADYFMSKPEYVERARRWWADELMYNDAYDFSYWRYIARADELVEQLYGDEIGYGTFVEELLASPYYVTRFSGQDRVNKAFDIFMGRAALPVESEDFEALWRLWRVENATDAAYGADYRRPNLDTRQCAGGPGTFLCESTLLGRHSVVIPLLNPEEPNDRDSNRIDLDDITDEQWELLRTPGRLFAGQTMFWEAAVDRVLSHFLRWEEGRDAFAKPPGTALPDVRDALVAWFLENRSMRQLERALVTSALYTAANRRDDSDELPIWAMGPLKQMTAEQWLYAIEDFTGRDLGDCDFRYPNVRSGEINEQTHYHAHTYPLADPAINRPDFSFRDAARVFGGCPDREVFLRQTSTGVVLSLEAAGLVAQACFAESAEGMFLFHDDDTRRSVDQESRATLIRQHFREALTLEPTALDIDMMMLFSDGCLSDLAACPAEELPNRVCASVLRSNEFLFY